MKRQVHQNGWIWNEKYLINSMVEDSMRLEPDSFKSILDNLHDGLYMVDTNRVITYWNRAAEKISGYRASEVIGRSCADNILTHIDRDGNHLCSGMCPLSLTIADKIPRDVQIYMHHKDGHRVPVSVRISPLTDEKGEITGGVELFTDISHHRVNELRIKELEKMAFLDDLTKIANRSFVQRELQSRLEEIKRFNMLFGIIFMDIDHFKNFNDQYGHDTGDLVLRYVAKTFSLNSRPFDFYGRWGGEEFLGIIRNINDTDLVNLGNRVRELIAKSYIMNNSNQTLRVTISIGATMALKDDTIESIVKRADELMYKSKEAGRNCLTFG
jgi:diguanylate cyclase (GGDEF)-like protein/PAS domain S-box-containing protein